MRSIDRLVGVDINAGYLDRAAKRYPANLPVLEWVCADVEREAGDFQPVELAYAGPTLLFYPGNIDF